ncbi:MAG: OmpA family protein [Myxococcaceae bacterium]|nr:OmpA family protein [Myxococcaceae bacterium]
MTLSLTALIVLSATPTYELDGHTLKVPTPIVFETGKATLAPESDAAIEFVKRYLDDKPSISTLRVEVHSDEQADEKAAQTLSEARAAAVVNALTKKGADCRRLIAVGFGSSKPVAPNDTPENRARNRRTAFVNAALRNRLIGGMPLDGGGVAAPTPCP